MLPGTVNSETQKVSLVMNEPPQCETFANGVADEPLVLEIISVVMI